jgi:hypothetical protein
MQKLSAANKAAVKHYLRTGYHDPNDRSWPGQNFMEVVANGDAAMREALISVVLERAPRQAQAPTRPVSKIRVKTGHFVPL